MKRMALQIAVVGLAVAAFGSTTAELLTDPAAQEIFNRDCIRLGTGELLPIRFETACRVLSRTSLADDIRRELGDDPSAVPVTGNGPGAWYYTDSKGRRTDIRELYRQQTDEHTFDLILLASGKRFFGGYDVIIHLQVIDAGPSGVVYAVSTHAWPHSRTVRFSARHIGPVRRWFKKKMQLIARTARETALRLCEAEAFRQAWLDAGRPKPAPPSFTAQAPQFIAEPKAAPSPD